jgi:glutamate N-acetyltransferase/amino-acid N-acetyltransferase
MHMTPDGEVAEHSLPLGFLWGAVAAGIKISGKPDLAIALAPKGTSAAAMYTSNQVVAAPVTVGRRHLEATGGRVRALLINAGNANCATGARGLDACLNTCIAAAESFQCIFDEVIPSSTGIIGVPFPEEKVIAAMPAARAALGSTTAHVEQFAPAILTTDTKMKVARALVDVDGRTVHILGVAKGAGMIHPQLGAPVGVLAGPPHATMLVYIFTDLAAEPAQLRELLPPIVERSFNSISIDGDTSTNDTVLLLASGASGVSLAPDDDRLQEVFTSARSAEEAKTLARAIAHSPLCKTAWSSADPNWGRLLSAAGCSGVPFDMERVTILIGQQMVYANGMRAPEFDEAATHAAMSEREYTITIDLDQGQAETVFTTCDLTHEYVSINADYSS